MIEPVLQGIDPAVELRRVEFVGPQVGEELAEQGGLAALFALALVVRIAALVATITTTAMANPSGESTPGKPPTFMPSRPVTKVSGRNMAATTDSTYMRVFCCWASSLSSSSCNTTARSRARSRSSR